MQHLNAPESIDVEKISPEKHPSGISRFFFGSLPRTMATIVIAFIGVAVIHALLAGPNSAKKNTDRKSQNQSREDLAEANKLLSEKNKTDQEKLLNLTKENQALKGQGLKEEIRLQPPVSALQPLAGAQSPPASAAADMQKHAPVFSSPGEAVNFMAAQ